MAISPLAGKPAPKEMLIDPARLEREYFERKPDLDDPGQLVGASLKGAPSVRRATSARALHPTSHRGQAPSAVANRDTRLVPREPTAVVACGRKRRRRRPSHRPRLERP